MSPRNVKHLMSGLLLGASVVILALFQNCSGGMKSAQVSSVMNSTKKSPLDDPPPIPGFKVMSLREFGAVGDGRTDDFAALNRAALTTDACLNGENLEYRIVGSLLIKNNICLYNIQLTQGLQPVDTSPYIKSLNFGEPGNLSAGIFEMRVYGTDPVLTAAQHKAVIAQMSTTTLRIDGAVTVNLKNVKVDKGPHEVMGASGISGISIRGATSVNAEGIEVWGNGRGSGITIESTKNAKLNNIHIHDMVWAPYAGDRPLIEAKVRDTFKWNNGPIYKYIGAKYERVNQGRVFLLRKQEVPNGPLIDVDYIQNQFAHVRTQEEISGLFIVHSENVEVNNLVIARLGAKFDTGFIPWQADGVTVGRSKNITLKNVDISEVWEGIDSTGDPEGVDTFRYEHVRMKDIHSFGLKFVYQSRNGVVRDAIIRNAAYAGVVLQGPVTNVKFIDVHTRETGVIHNQNQLKNLWSSIVTVSGFLMNGGAQKNNRFVDSTAFNIEHPAAQSYGFYGTEPNRYNRAGNRSSVGPLADRVVNFGAAGNYTYDQAAAEYKRVNGCEGNPENLIELWDRATSFTSEPAWDFARLTLELNNLKAAHISYCETGH